MKTIWKYPLEITDRQYVNMPEGAEALSVIVQDGVITLYALVNPHLNTLRRRQVTICGTGRPCNADASGFIGTVETNGGKLVWHVFVD